jgi:hypothetical protein
MLTKMNLFTGQWLIAILVILVCSECNDSTLFCLLYDAYNVQSSDEMVTGYLIHSILGISSKSLSQADLAIVYQVFVFIFNVVYPLFHFKLITT